MERVNLDDYNFDNYKEYLSDDDRLDNPAIAHAKATPEYSSPPPPPPAVLALLKYPFYPLFILDNGMNLIPKSLTVLTPA